MATHYGTLVGVARNPATVRPSQTSSAHSRGTDHVLVRDTVELAAAAANDLVSLAVLPSNTVLDPDGCIAWFDDLGTGVTMDVGDTTNVDGLTDGQDVAAAAGSFNLMKSVDVADYFKPLWQILGMSEDPGGTIELFAKVLGAAATGTLTWQIKGQAR